MSPSELQSWLVEEGLSEELDGLTRLTVRSALDNLAELSADDQIGPPPDWPRLLLAGSILGRSSERRHQEAALRIATAAVTLSSTSTVRDAAAVLLGKLSNFRAIVLAENRGLLSLGLEGRLGMTLRIEAQRRQMEQAVLVESSGSWLPVNEFQQRFWIGADELGWLSASAPTASGKTFVVLQWLLDRMRSTNYKVAVFLAPTRALVSEIEANLHALIGKSSDIDVSSLPLRGKYDSAIGGGSKLQCSTRCGRRCT